MLQDILYAGHLNKKKKASISLMKILCRQPLQQLQIEHFFKEGQNMYGTIINFYFNSN